MNIWTNGNFIFKSTASGINVYDFTTELLLGAINYLNASSIWANNEYLYIGTTDSGILDSPMSSISGGIYDDLDIYKDYPFIENHVNYIHGAGNYLSISTISGVHIFNTSTDIEVYFSDSIVAEKCHQLADRTSYYIYEDKLETVYNDDTTHTYQSGDGIIPTISGMNDLYVVSGTKNLILLGTTAGAVMIEENKGSEADSRFKYYYIEE